MLACNKFSLNVTASALINKTLTEGRIGWWDSEKTSFGGGECELSPIKGNGVSPSAIAIGMIPMHVVRN